MPQQQVSLKINIPEHNLIKTIQFPCDTIVMDACRIIKEKLTENVHGTLMRNDPNPCRDFGLFLINDDPKKGVWLENGRSLDYYMLRNGDSLEYKRKMRPLRIKTLDGSVKTVLVDDSQNVANLMVVICTKIGITNHDEYSLVRESEDGKEANSYSTGTLTLRREKRDKEKPIDKEMEQLKKKLKTDDDLNWVDHALTLREQGIAEDETLLLRRKFFFSDSNIDSRDPVQLNLLYVQTRDAIINGTHPVTIEEAVQFAGLQCQIQFGDFVESKHRPGFLDLREFLPKDYIKNKGVDKRVLNSFRREIAQDELEAKVKYVQLARSLKTYGVTFFLVKEKMKGKNKLVPRLLGVTKDSVLRLDAKTKEIMKTWPLTTVKRWAASPNSFTLDFGDYSDSYYSVQTPEGEQISQLIAGYIDIILKRKKAKDHFGIEGDEGSTMVEDSVAPYKATILQHQPVPKPSVPEINNIALPVVMRAGTKEPEPIIPREMPPIQLTTVKGHAHVGHVPSSPPVKPKIQGLTGPQRALLSTIDSGQKAIQKAERDLQTKTKLPDLGSDPGAQKWRQSQMDVKKQNVASQLAAVNAATAKILSLTSAPEIKVDTPAIGAAVSTIASNIPELSKDVKVIAALMQDEVKSDELIDAARRLCKALSDLLNGARPLAPTPRPQMLQAASKVGDASQAVVSSIAEPETEWDKETADILLAIAKHVANAAAALVLKAKSVASELDDDDLTAQVIDSATQCALATSQLVTTAKLVAPTIQSPSCQKQLTEACKEVARAVENVVKACQLSPVKNKKLIQDLREAAAAVTRALNDLLNQVRLLSSKKAKPTTEHDGPVDTIIDATDRLFSSTGNANEMVRQAKVLADATSELITDIKGKAGSQSDTDIAKRLLAAAKVLADATNRLLDAAKGCASNPHDSEQQAALKKAAEDLRNATNTAASNALRKKVIGRLEESAKQAARAATQNIAAAHGSAPHQENRIIREELEEICIEVTESMPPIIQSAKEVHNHPEDPAKQIQLIQASEAFVDPTSRLVSTSKAAIPTIQDPGSSLQMRNAAQELDEAIADLKSSIQKAQEACCSSFEIENAIDSCKELIGEVSDYKKASASGTLRPLPGETIEKCISQLNTDCKTVGSGMAELLTAASQGNEVHVGAAARDTTNALRDMTHSVRGVAATSDDPQFQVRSLNNAQEVLEKSIYLFEETRWALDNPEDPNRQSRLTYVAKDVSVALNSCVGTMPGQRDVDEAVRTISESSQLFSTVPSSTPTGTHPPSRRPFNELQQTLLAAATKLSESAGEVVQNSRSPISLASAAKRFTTVYGNFANAGLNMIANVKDPNLKNQLIAALKAVSAACSKLLQSAKLVASDPNSLLARNQLTAVMRALVDSVDNLINCISSGAPGQKEVDAAIRKIQMTRPLLENPSEPLNHNSYFESLDAVRDLSRRIRDIMENLGHSAEREEHEVFVESVRDGADSVCNMIENTAHCAYLVGASDPSSVAGRPGLVDLNAFHRSNDAIQVACQQLTNRNSTQQQVLSAATTIAKHTSSLCNSCRLASSRTANPIAKRYFVQSAKDVANATAALVREIKELDQDPDSSEKRQNCSTATRPLIDAVENLTAYASSSEFAAIPAKISEKSRIHQLPITSAGKLIIDHFCNLLFTAKNLVLNPSDASTWKTMSKQSDAVDDSMKKLIKSMQDASPGRKECDAAIEKLRQNMQELDQAAVSMMNQNLNMKTDHSFKTYREIMHSTLNEIGDKIEPVRVTGKCEAENIGHTVATLGSYFDPLIQNAIGCAAKTTSSKTQINVFNQTKTVCECAIQLFQAVRDCGGNPNDASHHAEIDDGCECLKEAIQDLTHTLQSTSSGDTYVPAVVDSISKSIAKLDERYSFSANDLTGRSMSFVDYQTRMVDNLKDITRIAQEIASKSANHQVEDLGVLTNNLAISYANLAADTVGAVTATSNVEVADQIKTAVQALGTACIHLTRATGPVQDDPRDPMAQKDVADQARNVCEKASYVLAALQAGSRGTQACINAVSTVNGVIGDLDTTIMFATAGTLNPEDENDQFAAHREGILNCAKSLVEDTKSLVLGAASDQEQLADAVQSAVNSILGLAETVKQGAASLGSSNSEAQVLLLNAAKDVAMALGDLIQATKSASGKSSDDPAMVYLKDTAKNMITNVTSLLKTVKIVEDEHQRGTRALEATIEALANEIRSFDSAGPPSQRAAPDDLIRITKPVTLATQKAVIAGNSGKQDDVITAANLGRKAIGDLLTTTRQAAYASDSPDLIQKTLESGRNCALKYLQLLKLLNTCIQRPTGAGPREKQAFVDMSREIAAAVTDVVSAAEMLKGDDWADPNDPIVIAETELLGAAASIDAASKKLASLQPRRTSIKLPQEDMTFDEMILDAAKSITAATAALIRAACAAQRELVAEGRVSAHPMSRTDDGEWSEGLISAARLVAAATHSLVEAANALVQGHASEERLISSAKQVASSTAHLLVACQVKADPDSKAMARLQAAGNAVKKATDNLVRAAQKAIEHDEELSLVVSRRKVPGIAQEISAREEILRKERELHDAREKLALIHKARYNAKRQEFIDNEYYYVKSDGEGGDGPTNGGPAYFYQQ
ncbi:talin-1-like [Brevipalpus obovatus]|uniref:talin-1-like n=1 Tax=Brevipalpus obovatus TaxID=246614 RepID=UPI003D9E9C87